MTPDGDGLMTRALVMAAQDGEEAAVRPLFELWNRRFVAHAARLSGDRAAAPGIAQEAWIAIIRSLGRLEDPARFRAWAYRIVTHKAADWVRARQRERKMKDELAMEMKLRGAGRTDPGNPGEAQQLRRLIAALPFEQRALLALYYREGFTVGEVAEALSIKPGTVKSRLHAARQRLRHQMERTEK